MAAAKRILIIDDDTELCEEASDALRCEGHFVRTACDARAGQECISGDSYDAIILDYKMPGLTGVDVLKFIKGKNINTKILLVSGRPFIDKLLKDENVSELVTCVINKPFNIQLILEKINS